MRVMSYDSVIYVGFLFSERDDMGRIILQDDDNDGSRGRGLMRMVYNIFTQLHIHENK